MTKYQSKIERLIAEKCPEGVEFLELGTVAKVGTGSSNGNESVAGGEYPLFVRSKFVKSINTFEFDEEAIIIPGEGGVGEIFHYVNGKYALHQRAYRIHFTDDRVLTKFAYYYLFANFLPYILRLSVNATVKSIRKPMIEKFKIPLPPLVIQEEIVKILDSFTELEDELEDELEARKMQYEHYYKRLLTANDGVQITLNEVGKVSMCKRIFKNETLASGDIPFYKIGTFGKEPNAFISKEIYDEYRKKFSFPKKGDVLLSASGTIGRRVIYNGESAYFQDSNIIWIDNDESKVLNKFLYYLYATVEWKTEGGTIQRLYNDNLKKIKIPVPPLAEQARIVAILDKFDALVNDLSVGLPAELNARRKQYEYYRNKLLTFKPLEKEYAKQ